MNIILVNVYYLHMDIILIINISKIVHLRKLFKYLVNSSTK